jgi:signal transduction histidine kinase
MRIHTRFRLSIAVSLVAILAIGGAMAWSLRAASRASASADVATSLQRDIFERILLRDEFLLYREPRARGHIREKTNRLLELLHQADAHFRDPEERRIAGEMIAGVEQTRARFLELAELPDDRTLSGERHVLAVALRERLTSNLMLLSYDLSSNASRLEELASRNEEAARRQSLVLSLALMVAALVITIANAVLTGSLLQRRIARLREGAQRIASGDLGSRLGLAGDDELADLARTFDGMAARLEEGRATLDREVAERRLAGARLEAANAELESFSYSVSHDLRAPLRHVSGFVNLLSERARGGLDEKSQHYLQVISASAQRMGVLIDDLLAFSRTGRAEMKVTRVELRPLLDEAIRELAGEADGREICWSIRALPEVAGDPAMLRQVWFNLVANALKFSRPRSPARIEIGAEVRGADEVRCWIKDNGVGFEMRYADKLFGVFQRLHTSDRFEGTGIGLANVQRIIARHGGRVWAEGKVEEGAVFWFSLPQWKGNT